MEANENTIAIKKRIKILKQLTHKKDKFETINLNKWKLERGLQQDLRTFHDPVIYESTSGLNSITQLKYIAKTSKFKNPTEYR